MFSFFFSFLLFLFVCFCYFKITKIKSHLFANEQKPHVFLIQPRISLIFATFNAIILLLWLKPVLWKNRTICSTSPILHGATLSREDSSNHSATTWNLPFWDDTAFNFRYLWVFQVNHTFYKLDMEILADYQNSWIPSPLWAVDLCQQKHSLFWQKKQVWDENQYSL